VCACFVVVLFCFVCLCSCFVLFINLIPSQPVFALTP
jgi:hypothetical protein